MTRFKNSDEKYLGYGSDKMVSLRIPSNMIVDLKAIASIKKIGYQSLLKLILRDYISEYKEIYARETEQRNKYRKKD